MEAVKYWIQLSDADPDKHKIWATFYDPLGANVNIRVCQAKWLSFTLPLLQKWVGRDQGRSRALDLIPTPRVTRSKQGLTKPKEEVSDVRPPSQAFPTVTTVDMKRPRQTDAVSYGLLCVAQAYSYVSRVLSLKTSKTISLNDLAHMRLRLLWTILQDLDTSDKVWAELLHLRKAVQIAFATQGLIDRPLPPADSPSCGAGSGAPTELRSGSVAVATRPVFSGRCAGSLPDEHARRSLRAALHAALVCLKCLRDLCISSTIEYHWRLQRWWDRFTWASSRPKLI
ncbi:hypothetical protein GQ600_3005 [Phytophthora cactorum]|nr:hypothetical protein GQ600_3005 [Phytophthora cactorum]